MKHFKPASTALAIVLLAGGPVAAQAPTQWTGFVAPNDRVEVVNIRGTIHAVVSTDGMVRVNARPSDPSVMRVDVVEHAGGVKVCALPVERSGGANGRCTSDERGPWPRLNEADIRVDIEVSVPEGVRLSATSVAGEVRVEQLRSDVNVTMVSGRVLVESAGFPARITSVSGDVRIEVPANANADFHATTLSGAINSDVPISSGRRNVRLPDGQRLFDGHGPQNVRATLGSGGPELQVTTVSGGIELRQR